MQFRPGPPLATANGRSAIELWDGAHQVATIYAQASGLHIVFDTGYEPEIPEIRIDGSRIGLQIHMTRSER